MPIVINEFEVVTSSQEAPPPATAAQQTPPRPQVREIEQITRRQMERAARVRAH
jgi:hypothetical protein